MTEGLAIFIIYNPSVSLTAATSLYTREALYDAKISNTLTHSIYIDIIIVHGNTKIPMERTNPYG